MYQAIIRTKLDKLVSFIRWPEWYDSKIPPIVGWVYYALYRLQFPCKEGISTLFAVTLFTVLYLVYGYVLNDYSDIEVDRKAGKRKHIANLQRGKARAIIIVIGLVGILSLFVHYSKYALLMIDVIGAYILATLYSLPPVRLKERGIWGILAASVAQRIFPLLIGMCVLGLYDFASFLWLMTNFLIGLRYIFIHQYIDRENDLHSGVRTFATQHSVTTLHTLIIIYLVLESIFTVWLGIAIGFSPLTMGVFALSVISRILAAKRFERTNIFVSFTYVPLSEILILFFPATLLIFLVSMDIHWALLIPIELVWKYKFMKRYLAPFLTLVRIVLGKSGISAPL